MDQNILRTENTQETQQEQNIATPQEILIRNKNQAFWEKEFSVDIKINGHLTPLEIAEATQKLAYAYDRVSKYEREALIKKKQAEIQLESKVNEETLARLENLKDLKIKRMPAEASIAKTTKKKFSGLHENVEQYDLELEFFSQVKESLRFKQKCLEQVNVAMSVHAKTSNYSG